MRTLTRSLSTLFLTYLTTAIPSPSCAGTNAVSPNCPSSETPHIRSFFYIGGRALPTPNGTLTADQIYVEKLTPLSASRKQHPIVFFHGGGTSAVSFLNTPDNRQGWASWFLEKGYVVYLVDAYTGARSPANNFNEFVMAAGPGTEAIQSGYTAPAANHTQFPGSGLDDGDASFDAFKKAMIPWTLSFEKQELAMRASGCELLRLLGTPAFLISHSLGSFYPILLSNDCPQYVKASVNLEPATSPFWRYNRGALGGVPQSPWGLTFSRLSYEPPVQNASGM